MVADLVAAAAAVAVAIAAAAAVAAVSAGKLLLFRKEDGDVLLSLYSSCKTR